MADIERPLSPHLQIYRPQITSVLSILHRITGVALGAGALLLTWWLVAAAVGPEAYAAVQVCIGSFFGRLILFGFSFALFFHLCNGIRHLAWDLGLGLDIPTVTRSGWAVVAASVALTLLAWSLGYGWRG